MKLFRLELKILSPTGSLWQSDTLFGHICWQIALREGEQALKAFLQPFLDGKPPFVLSDGFPRECLPMPLPPPEAGAPKSLEEYQQHKKVRKQKYCLKDDFLILREGFGNQAKQLEAAPGWQQEVILHTAIDRNTGGAMEGQLYSSIAQYFPGPGTESFTDIYLLCQPEWEAQAVELLEMTAETGYGKDKSTGSGHFELYDYYPADELLQMDNPTGFMTLSSYVPKQEDPTAGRYKLRTKYGRLSEGAGNGNPFKRPLLQIEPGAVLQTESVRPYYGRMVENIAPGMPEAVQYGFTIALPIRN